jgi:hypothetical protein
MVLSIPFSSFPKDQRDWILWGTSTRIKDGIQIDHVGRSNRSQQGRFDFLNTLPPSQHVAAIKAHNQTRMRIETTLMEYWPPLVNAYQPLFKIRPYDDFPDVMIYTNQYPIGFPNGRKLTDDVAALTCDQGDCALVEGAYIDSPGVAARDGQRQGVPEGVSLSRRAVAHFASVCAAQGRPLRRALLVARHRGVLQGRDRQLLHSGQDDRDGDDHRGDLYYSHHHLADRPVAL